MSIPDKVTIGFDLTVITCAVSEVAEHIPPELVVVRLSEYNPGLLN